jgi:hypothetical protein
LQQTSMKGSANAEGAFHEPSSLLHHQCPS